MASKATATLTSCLRNPSEYEGEGARENAMTRLATTAANDSTAASIASSSKTPQPDQVLNDSANLKSNTLPASPQPPLRVKFCRYEAGRMVKHDLLLGETSYVTISHVWGKVFWQEIPGVDGEIRVSKEKAKFIMERLPSIVGDEYFWMDILCVDQRNKDARIAVTQHIPRIFRSAKRTIVVRNGEGLRDCCSHVTEHIHTLDEWWTTDRALITHFRQSHLTEACPDEAVLTRLWPLQEIMLSDDIRFVRCDTILRHSEEQEAGPDKKPSWDPSEITWSILAHLSSMAGAWYSYGTDATASADEALKFSLAFINSGSVSRCRWHKSLQFPALSDLRLHLHSSRRTSHPRDFILAIMPQYEFYKVPPNVKSMTFSELYRDCFQQGKSAGFKLTPLLTVPEPDIGHSITAQTPDFIPEPACLGDLVRLFLGATQRSTSTQADKPLTAHKVEIRIANASDVAEAQRIITESIACTKGSWANIRVTQLSTKSNTFLERPQDLELKRDPSSEMEIEWAISICGSLYDRYVLAESKDKNAAGVLESFDETLPQDPIWANSAILLAALLPCGLGVGAFGWSKENLTPVSVKFRGQSILALLPNSVIPVLDICEFTLVEVEPLLHERFSLRARWRKCETEFSCACLFPLVLL